MVAQVACIHAQGFGINFVPLHHIVAKAPCIARGTMLKPGSSPGFFSFGCTRIFLFLDIKKRPKLLKFGRFVYIFVYVLRKTLIFKVYCGETGIRTPGTSRYNGFQDRRNRPLCHLSKTLRESCLVFQRRCKGRDYFLFCKQKRKNLFIYFMINQERKIPKIEIVVLKIKNVRES